MTTRRLPALALAAFVAVQAVAALAVTPDEVLSDPALEARARDISAGLRCMICQNQSIDESDAALAKDLRVLVRERLKAGDTDGQVIDYVVSRYGEFVLLRPRMNWRNALLWGTPAVLLLAGGLYILGAARRRHGGVAETAGLTDEERAALAEALKRDA